MKRFGIFPVLILSTVVFYSCSKSGESAAGVKFTYLRKTGGDVVQPGQFLMLDLTVRDGNDSLWLDTRQTKKPAVVRVDAEDPKVPAPGETGVYRLLAKGDSVTFTLALSAIYSTWMKPVPAGKDKDLPVTYHVVVRDIFDNAGLEAFQRKKQEEYENMRANHQIKQFGVDTLLIDSLLKAKGITAQKNESGIRYTVKQSGRGPLIERGDVVRVIYRGYTPDGKVFDSNTGGEPLEVVAGAGRVIRGWDEMLQLMQNGGRYTIYIPSILAYGDQGFMPDIKPDAVLIFDMEIKSVRKQ